MTDVFFAYSSKDRERVQPIRDALVAEGFDVFWDQEVPPGREWDEWIRQHLNAARCAMVFWSGHSVNSDEIVHEAMLAKSSGKVIPILLKPLESGQVPMGHSIAQAVVIPQRGLTPEVFQRLCAIVETRAIRPWMRRKLAELEVQLSTLSSIQGQMEDREASLQRRIGELEEQVELERVQKKQLEVALATEKLQTAKSKSLSASSVAQQQTILRLNNELLEEGKIVNKLRTEMAYLESGVQGDQDTNNPSQSDGTSQYVRDVYLLIATILLLVSAANGSTPAMVISSMLLMGGAMWGFFLR